MRKKFISSHTLNSTHNSAGFSLIELLVVLVILGMLASLVAPKITKYLGQAKTKTARVQIEELGVALDLYKLEVGNYPTTNQGLIALTIQPDNINDWNGPYLKKLRIPKDPWNMNYIYHSPGNHGDYDLLSYGADMKPEGEKDNSDISSWE